MRKLRKDLVCNRVINSSNCLIILIAHRWLDGGTKLQLHIFLVSLILVSVSNLQWDLSSATLVNYPCYVLSCLKAQTVKYAQEYEN